MDYLRASSIRILIGSEGKVPAGAGFLVTSSHVMTCAHVVASALRIPKDTVEGPEGTVYLDFPLLEGQPMIETKVLKWHPVKQNPVVGEVEDIAVLELLSESTWPTGIAPASVVPFDSDALFKRPVWMLGFPKGIDDGKYVNGKAQGLTGTGWIEIQHELTGGLAEEGFSGAAVWCSNERVVLGMLVSTLSHKAETTAYMIPASTLVRALPGLTWAPDHEILAYFAKAEALYENLSLVGFRTRLRVPIHIEDIYLPLGAIIDLRATGDACFGDALEAARIVGERGCGKEISLPDAFHDMQRMQRRGIVILGDPGSGKTTHLKRLLLWTIRGGLADLGLPADILPVFLPLRELRNLDGGLDAFVQEQLDKPHLGTSRGFGERLLSRGNLLLLFDGLDEVSAPDHRARVSRWIEKALKLHRSCLFVVTSRFAGYTPQARLDEQFMETHIRPFTEEQAKAFIRNWYQIVERGISSDQQQADILASAGSDDLIERLSAPEFRARRVFELTRNPMLLTNLCLVHKDRGNLPKSRARLYEECTDVLLELWRTSGGLPTTLTAQSGRRVLQPVALWLHQEENRTRARASELAPVVEPALKSVGWADGTAEEFLRAVRDESGLLTGWDQEHYGFMHLGFQEYLAAREIQNRVMDPDVLRELANHFGDAWWQEVILLMLSLDNPCLFEPFMREVVKQPTFVAHPALLEMCLDDAVEKSPQPFLELLRMDAQKDPRLWERQLTALRILERLDKSALEPLLPVFRSHPDSGIRKWVRERGKQDLEEVFVPERGGYVLLRIPGGHFFMGSPESEEGRTKDESPVHEVTVPEFYLGRYPVTNAEYGAFLAENAEMKEPEYWGDRRFNQPSHPVVGVSWEEARKYARWAGLRLPSEAEWEYACRAGTTTRYYTGDSEEDLARVGWYHQNSGGQSHPVGEKEPNAFGLCDMHGNVWEWMEDDWHETYDHAPCNGSAWVDSARGSGRVIRGGAWGSHAVNCRSAVRFLGHPGNRRGSLGFRLARSLP